MDLVTLLVLVVSIIVSDEVVNGKFKLSEKLLTWLEQKFAAQEEGN